MEKALERQGICMKRTPVGDKYVSLEMQEHGYSIGGEESGHIIFNKYSTTGDGILTAIRVMEIIVGKKTMASFLTAGVSLFPKVQINKRDKRRGRRFWRTLPSKKALIRHPHSWMVQDGC